MLSFVGNGLVSELTNYASNNWHDKEYCTLMVFLLVGILYDNYLLKLKWSIYFAEHYSLVATNCGFNRMAGKATTVSAATFSDIVKHRKI